MRIQSDIEQLLRQRVADHPDAPWLYFGDDVYTWAQGLSLCQRAANALLGLGLVPGDRVGIMAGNKPEFLWAQLGCMLIGCEVVPVNKWLRGAGLTHVLNDSGIRALVYDTDIDEVIGLARPDCPGLKWTAVLTGALVKHSDAAMASLMAAAPDAEPEVAVSQAVGAVGLIYTSGTTGPAKGIVAKVYESHLGPLLDGCGVKAGETLYTCMPLFHAGGLMVFAMGSIRRDMKLALAEGFSASRFWDDCDRYGAVCANVFGVMIPYLLKQPPRANDRHRTMRAVLSVGCPPAAWDEFQERFGVRIVEIYGATDAVGFLVNTDGRRGAAGKPQAGAEFRIVDANDEDVPPDTPGEIVYRHPASKDMYYHNLPEASRQAWRGGWYHSGDLGRRDADGYFYFLGRVKESIRRRGENISAWEVSSVIDLNPKVLESAAFGVPSDLGEEEVMVAVVPKPGETLTAQEILDFCQGRLAYFALPRYVDIVATLPKTSTQKVQHLQLKEKGRSADTWDREKAGYQIRRA